MNEPSVRWMTWSASSLQANSTVAAHEILQHAASLARHLEAHDALAPLGLEAGAVGVGRRRPTSGCTGTAASRARPPCVRRPSPRASRSRGRRGRCEAARRPPPGIWRCAATGSRARRDRRSRGLRPSRAPASESRGGSAPARPRRCAAGRCRRCAARTCPPCRREYSQLNRAVRTPPMCRNPVGLGANRVRGGVTRSSFRVRAWRRRRRT